MESQDSRLNFSLKVGDVLPAPPAGSMELSEVIMTGFAITLSSNLATLLHFTTVISHYSPMLNR